MNMRIGLLVLFFVVSVGAANSPSNVICPTGCSCPRAEIAVCCLFPDNQTADSFTPLSCQLLNGQHISVTTDAKLRWPLYESCSSQWTDLTVLLVPRSWPPSPPNLPCNGHLKRISISGTPNDGLSILDAKTLRSLFFGDSVYPALQSLIIEHTDLERIEPGLFDKLATRGLTDLAIRSNRNLKSPGLLVSWLAETPALKRLDLSSNQLEDLDFVRWGVAQSSRLTSLNLSNNSLKHIDNRAFAQFPFLVELSLANNQLTSISLEALDGLKSLKRLDLSGNLLNLFGLLVARNLPPFSIFLPHLSRLDLSSNPLMHGIKEPIEWWLSSGCPVGLTDLLLNYISVSPVTVGSYPLPPIMWSNCQGLTHVYLFQTPSLFCLPSDWLQLQDSNLPSRPKFLTSANSVCPLSTPPSTTTMTPQQPGEIANSGFWNLFGDQSSSTNFGVQLLIICIIAGLFVLTISLIIVSICMCLRRSHHKPLSKQQARSQNKLSESNLAKTGPFDSRTMNHVSAYFGVDGQLPMDCCIGGGGGRSISPLPNQPFFPMQRSESRVLYNDQGVPVSYLVPTPASQPSSIGGEMHPLLLPDGSTAYYPVQIIPMSGRGTPHYDQHSSAASYHGSQMLKPVLLPLLQQNPEYAIKCRPVAPNINNQHQFSALSCKSTSFSSLGGSMHSGRGEQQAMVGTSRGPQQSHMPQSEEPPSMSQQPLIAVGTSSSSNSAATSVSPPSPHSEEEGCPHTSVA